MVDRRREDGIGETETVVGIVVVTGEREAPVDGFAQEREMSLKTDFGG